MTTLFPDPGEGRGWVIPLGWKADNEGACRSCRAPVMWCVTPAGKRAPVDPDGQNHFITCPDRDAWRKRA
ncbi:MAG: hypothetical protein ACYDCI_05675 [Candidatus Limnocylindrales bacterium]